MIEAARLQHANELIELIGSFGRYFFRYQDTATADYRFARFKFDRRNLCYIDEYTGSFIYLNNPDAARWDGFSHGGTLKDLIRQLADYIIDGAQISTNYIAPKLISTRGNQWGYIESEAIELRLEAFKSPIFFGYESFIKISNALLHNYAGVNHGINKSTNLCQKAARPSAAIILDTGPA